LGAHLLGPGAEEVINVLVGDAVWRDGDAAEGGDLGRGRRAHGEAVGNRLYKNFLDKMIDDHKSVLEPPLKREGQPMRLAVQVTFGLQLFALAEVAAQGGRPWKVRGDTAGAAPGCSATSAIATIDRWFTSFNRADSIGLISAMASKHWVVSTGKFTSVEPFVRIETWQRLVHYTRGRVKHHHERMMLEGVRFYGWINERGRQLGFMPYFVRAADDLGGQPRLGIGKASYRCSDGIIVMNLAPRPTNDPGLDP
jgi:hypothetical protein